MEESMNREIASTVRMSMLALVAVLGVPSAIYFGLQGPLGAGTANGLALVSSILLAVTVFVVFLWWHE
jgi:glycerol-3-phosphate acyltransferase PlsY